MHRNHTASTQHRIRPALALAAGLATAALALTACSSTPATTEGAAPTTVVVENAKPTLHLVEEKGESSLAEDRDVKRGSVEVAYQPSKVVTFDIATLDTLDAIGAGDSVIGIPQVALPEYLQKYADLPKVGTLFEPDFEAVAGLEPDLIVTAARSTPQYDELSKIATTIDLTGAYSGVFSPAGGLERATQLGEIYGKQDEVAKHVAAANDLISSIKGRATGTALVLSVSGGEYGAYGEGSRFGYFFDELGFTPAVKAAELPGAEGSPHGDTVSNEFILTANPDWIIAFDRGAATGESSSLEATLDNELVKRTTAGAEGNIIALPASELYIVINGLQAITNVLTVVHDALAS